MREFIRLTRPSVVLLTALGVFVGAFLSDFSIYPQIIIAILSVALIAGGGNALNDYFDYKTDWINKPHRAIPSGKVKKEDVLLFSVVLLTTGLLLSVLLNIYNVTLALLNVFLIFVYNAFLKRIPLIGNFIPSWLAASSFLYGGLLSLQINPVIILLFSMSFLANTGREVAKSVEDMDGDGKAGFKTLPVVAGERFSILIAAIFIVLAVAFSPFPYFYNLLSPYYLLLVMVADFIFIFSLLYLLNSVRKSQTIMKIAMFTSFLAFVLGAI